MVFYVGKLLTLSFLLWAFLSTALPQLSPEIQLAHKLPQELRNKRIQLMIAHPDDEVMFFGPSVVELMKPEYGNSLSVTCLSSGNDVGLGDIRSEELRRSLEILGVGDNYELIDDESRFKDSMSIEWSADEVAKHVHSDTDLILTFDDRGISSHPNHISMFRGAIESGKAVYCLKSWSMVEKYSGVLFTNLKLVAEVLHYGLSDTLKSKTWFIDTTSMLKSYMSTDGSIEIFADIPTTTLVIAAMMNAHVTQMQWFRYGWIFASRYFNANELIRAQ